MALTDVTHITCYCHWLPAPPADPILQMCTAALHCSPQPFLRGCFVFRPQREKCSTSEERSKSCTSPARPPFLLGRWVSAQCPAASPQWCKRFFPCNAFSQYPQVAFRLDFEFSKSVFLQSMEIYLVANRLMLAAPPCWLQHRSPSACSSLLGGWVGRGPAVLCSALCLLHPGGEELHGNTIAVCSPRSVPTGLLCCCPCATFHQTPHSFGLRLMTALQ